MLVGCSIGVVSGSAFVSGAQVGVKGTLYFDGTDMLISGAVKAVELDSAAEPAAKTLYGSATVNGDTAAEAGFDTDTYKVGGEIAKKLTNKQVGSTTPAAPSLTLTETSKSLTAGKTAVFTANYTGTDTLNAYVQGNAVNGYFTISQKNNGDGTYTVSVKIDEETPGGTYTLFVHEVGNTSVQASATITVIGLPDAAEVNGKQYKSLPRALAAAQDGDTVKLLADHVTDADALNALGENFSFEQYASIVPVVTKTLTLDLNHKTVDYLEVGFSETNEETQKKETLATGNLTVTGEGAYGRISNLMFMAGALDIRSGEIGGSEGAGLFCDANSGPVTVSNGTVYGLTVMEGASVTVNGGSNHAGEWVVASGATLNITDGTFGEVQFTRNGTIAISGGTFKSIKSYIAEELQPLMSLLDTQKVHAFYKGDDVQDGNATELADVTVKEHTHAMVNNKCDCGLSCTHTNTEGASTIGKDGKCTTCGTQFAAKANGNYYKHLANALAESSVDRVTLVADDTLLADVTLNEDTIFYLNGHTVSGGGAIVVPSGKWLELREENETEKAGNAGAIRVEDGGSLIVGEDFTGTVQTLTVSEKADVKLLGGMYGTITGSREKAGTLLYNNNNHALAFQKQDGSFVRYDQRIPSETPLENVTVDFCRHEQLTEACDGACEYCNGALGARIGSQGYWNLNTEGDGAVYHVKNGETIVLLKDSDPKFGSSLNSDCAYTIDLNGHSTINGWTVSAGAPKIVDSKGGGKISQLSIGSSLDLTLADLLPKGWDFQKSDGSWLSTTELKGKTASNVTVAQLPIQSMGYPTEMSMDYGGTGTLIVNVRGTGAVRFQWYKVEDGKATEVGSATAKNQFDLSALKLSAGNHTFRFSATCDGYKKMSQDIVVTVQKANIGSNRIMPPTAQENLTYTGQEQALITAGSVTSGGTMQYSLTENGTYSQDSPTGTDAGAYTVWYRVIGDENHNDTAPASVAVRIGQKPLTITEVTAASKTYDGTTNAGITSVTFDNVTLTRDTDYTVTASFDDAGVGSGKNVTATVTLMGQTAKNYFLEQSSFHTTGNITKAAAPDFTKATALVVVNGHEKTYTVTLPALPKLETPKEYGALTYEISEIKLDGHYYTSGAKVENGELILPIQKNDVKTTGSVGTVTVVIKSTNYEDITLTVNVNATNKLVPTVTAPTANALTYNGAEQALVTAGKTTGGTMLYRLDDSEWSEQLPTAKNAGEYTVWYKVQGNAEYANVAEQNVTVTVAKKSVTVTALDKSAYTGSTAPDLSSPKADKDYKVEGLVGADTLSGTVTLTYEQTPDMSKAGEIAINITDTLSNDNYEITYVSGTLTVSKQSSSDGGSSSGGSGGGGDSSSGGSGNNDNTNQPKEKPQAPVTGETKPIQPDKNGNAAVDNSSVQSAIDKAKQDAKKNGTTENGIAVTVPITSAAGQTSFNVTIKAQTLDLLVKENVRQFTVAIDHLVSVNIGLDTLKQLDAASAGGDIILRANKVDALRSTEAKAAIETRPAYDLSLVYLSGGKETPITSLNGHTISVRLSYTPAKGEQTGNLYAVYVDDVGKVEWITKSSYDASLKAVVFETGHFSVYGVGYKNPAPAFTDIHNHWAADNILFAASRGLLSGTSDTTFSPNTGMTRGMFVTALGRLAGINPDSYQTGKFTDVKADAYYAPYVNWAAQNGIVEGVTATTFAPDTNINREQMAVIMANYAKKLGYDLPKPLQAVTFADNAQISSWAKDAVKSMQQAGILAGKNGNKFDPKGTATRAEVATVLRRFVEIVIDPQTANGWQQNDSGQWSYYRNGKPVKGWLSDDQKWYWLDKATGMMFAGGWKQIDGKWYYFYTDGTMAVNTTIDGYTIGSDGARK